MRKAMLIVQLIPCICMYIYVCICRYTQLSPYDFALGQADDPKHWDKYRQTVDCRSSMQQQLSTIDSIWMWTYIINRVSYRGFELRHLLMTTAAVSIVEHKLSLAVVAWELTKLTRLSSSYTMYEYIRCIYENGYIERKQLLFTFYLL